MVKCILALTIVGSMPHGTTQAFTELPVRRINITQLNLNAKLFQLFIFKLYCCNFLYILVIAICIGTGTEGLTYSLKTLFIDRPGLTFVVC